MNYFNKKNVLIGVLILAILVGGIIYFKKSSDFVDVVNNENLLLTTNEINTEEVKTGSKVKLEVKGEVVNPGVYELDSESRLQDLIDASGGFKDSAYYDNINLSKKIKDEMVLFVYSKTAIKKVSSSKKNVNIAESSNKTNTTSNNVSASSSVSSSENASDECAVQDYNIESCIEKNESIIVVDSSASGENENKDQIKNNTQNYANANSSTSDSTNKTTEKTLVNINTAGIKELTTLSGIGEAKAQKIIDYRNANGLFKSIEDITKVSGIGKATYEKFKANITI